ncbi:uncharacterized protein LOC129607507 [Condylostylus longicornis]|uniref:uncharacterized protein LOC129607507 n=1 Tax=Condylostylus longicornis TaxID=2530218 RepID=UPI00244DD869|nr:uncharacterized protein LOC129607507 [Condylostylus longicornis]
MNLKIILLIFMGCLMQIPWSDSAKILGLFTSQSKSHAIIHMSVARALIENGHNLTIVTTIDLNESNKNFRHIKVPGTDIHNLIKNMTQMSTTEKFFHFFHLLSEMMDNSRVALQSAEMQKLMKEESFDLVLLGYFVNEYEVGVAAHFKCPTIISWMGEPLYALNSLVGNPNEILSIPHPVWGGIEKNMGFFGRVKNVFLGIVDHILWRTIRMTYKSYYVELFPPEKYPSYEEALKNVSLILSNYHFSQGPIRADVPAVIQIGGIQIEENPKKLPEKIQKHLDSAGKDGAIFFSLGSNVRSADLGANASTAIYNVLSSLKQKVVWKWETDDLPGKSKNILFEKWLPQNSVLAHPNLKLFITHGGRGSVVESEYFGVPMIGLPVFGDQSANVDQLVEAGYGLRLDHSVLTEENLRDAINKIFTDSKYSENIKRFRDLFRDRPMTPKESAVYWVNYVLRHNGAKHMQSAAVHMSFYQLMGLDVLAFIGILLYVWLKLTIFTCKLLWRASCYVLCCKCFRKSGDNNKKAKLKPKKEYKVILMAIAFLTTQISFSESANILGLFTSRIKSHVIIYMSVARALIEHGHNLTIVTTVDLEDSNSNYRHIKVPGSDYQNIIGKMVNFTLTQRLLNTFNVFSIMMENSRVALKSLEMKNLLSENSFDLILLGYFMNEYEIGVAAHFKCPVVLVWMIQPYQPINTIVGNPSEMMYIPNPVWVGKIEMNFFGRMKNVLFSLVDNVLYWNLRRKYTEYYNELFPPEKYPPYEETLKNISLVLSNYHFSQGPVRADVPAIIQIGGIQIEENTKPLPEDIKNHLENAGKNGAILFSLGSNVKSNDLNPNTINIIFKVLTSLKQNIIWKWDSGQVPGNSKNILFKNWIPQNDILAHPNLKLFITHGGKGSVVESEYFGVPMIGLPIFGDQISNVDEFVEVGYGLRLDYKSLSELELKNAINEILLNPKYSENIKNFSKLFRDRPMTPKETVVYWVNYVLRHNGAKHMQSTAVHMPFYQLMGLDVLSFIGIVLYLFLKLIKFLCKLLWKIFCYVLCCKCFGRSVKNYESNQLKSKKEI